MGVESFIVGDKDTFVCLFVLDMIWVYVLERLHD